jgi:hypothetical protein
MSDDKITVDLTSDDENQTNSSTPPIRSKYGANPSYESGGNSENVTKKSRQPAMKRKATSNLQPTNPPPPIRSTFRANLSGEYGGNSSNNTINNAPLDYRTSGYNPSGKSIGKSHAQTEHINLTSDEQFPPLLASPQPSASGKKPNITISKPVNLCTYGENPSGRSTDEDLLLSLIIEQQSTNPPPTSIPVLSSFTRFETKARFICISGISFWRKLT